jgi:3-dehydroquinate dehydratase
VWQKHEEVCNITSDNSGALLCPKGRGVFETIINNNNNQQVKTNGTFPKTKPDIVIRHNETRRCLLININILGDMCVTKKEIEKILKYKNFTKEVELLWNVETKVVSVIMGETGSISR